MALPFDATLKELAASCPADFLALCHHPVTEPISVLNVDLSTITTATDSVFGLGEPLREIVHFDFQASASITKHRDVLAYNALLHREHEVPIASIVLLLRPQAAHYNLTGAIDYESGDGATELRFRYELIRLWQQPVEEVLQGALGILPLAPLCEMPQGVTVEQGVASILPQMEERLQNETSEDERRKLLTAAFTLTGLRIPRDVALNLFKGVSAMEESTTYTYIVEQGEIKRAKKDIVILGEEKFGPPSETISAQLAVIDDLARLESIVRAIMSTSSWEELLRN